MTVIATVITRHFTAFASDSFITRPRTDGSLEILEDRASKLVQVTHWRGAMGYWGLATHDAWNTKDWLEDRAKTAGQFVSAEAFASDIAESLTREFAARKFPDGLGIHFTAYEEVDGFRIPELFQITNWTDASYSAVRPSGFVVTRETYATLKNLLPQDRPPEHRDLAFRMQVHAALHDTPLMFRFNNGDPRLFNPVAAGIMDTFATLHERGHLADAESARAHLSLVRRPVDVVSRLLSDLADPDSRVIGGKPHDLAVNPGGEYHTTTGF